MKLPVNARSALLIVTLAWCAGASHISFALDEAKIHVAGTPNITSFVYHVGKEKGFYREEGIELQPIMAGMLQGIQGLIGGSFDYSQMLGQGGGAIMRGALKTFYWLKANEKEVAARLAKATKTSDGDGLELYRTGVKLFSQDGSIPPRLQERMIAMQRKVLRIEKEIAPESVYDFSFVRAANKELGKGN
jgi:ABC-type nitrate/sulfonate/bicarbonate transport system substrate-binding protein